MTDELLTVHELSQWLKVNKKTIYNRMYTGIYRKNVHYYAPAGTHPRFIRAAMEKWLKDESANRNTFPLPDDPKEAIRHARRGLPR